MPWPSIASFGRGFASSSVLPRFAPLAITVLLGLSAPVFAGPPTAPAASLEEVLAPLTTDRLFTSAEVGLQIVNVRTGEEVFARNADRGMIPASTMKIVTAATALDALGPAYRYSTDFLVGDDVKVGPDGTLKGNLYVRGHGDPTLVVETLWKITRDLKLAGLKRIEGSVVYDEGFFTPDYALPGWDKEADVENGPTYFATIGALSLNYNTVALVVAPGDAVGKAGRVELETPASDYVEITNKVVTTAPGTRRSLKIERALTDDQPPHLEFTVTGTVPAESGADRYYRTVIDPTAHFIAAFDEMLGAQGIEVTGKHVRGAAPDDADLYYRHKSDELTEILMEMNKLSNNFIAETVLRTVGAEKFGLPGTTEKGTKAVAAYLGTIGVEPGEITLVNGSGLSRGARLRPSTLTAVLLDMAHDRRVGHEFISSLAIAGRDGTLSRRLAEDPGRTRGKTGTIDGVHCLTGYTEGGDGELYAFAFLVNDVSDTASVKRLQDKFIRKIYAMNGPAPALVEASPAEEPDEGEEN